MAGKSGKNGLVKFGSDTVASMTGWSFSETVGTVDTTAAGDTAETHDTTYPSWSGEAKFNKVDADAAQGVRAGDSVDVEFYWDGNAIGKTYYSGTATVETIDLDAPHDGVVAGSVKLKGNGALQSATVS